MRLCLLFLLFLFPCNFSFAKSTELTISEIWETIHTWHGVPHAKLDVQVAKDVWMSHDLDNSCDELCRTDVIKIIKKIGANDRSFVSVSDLEQRGLSSLLLDQYGDQETYLALQEKSVLLTEELIRQEYDIIKIISLLSFFRHLIAQQNNEDTDLSSFFGKKVAKNQPLYTGSPQFIKANEFLTAKENLFKFPLDSSGPAYEGVEEYMGEKGKKIGHVSRLIFNQDGYAPLKLAEIYWAEESDLPTGFLWGLWESIIGKEKKGVFIAHGPYLMKSDSLNRLNQLVRLTLDKDNPNSIYCLADVMYLIANFTFIARGGGFLTEVIGESLRRIRFPDAHTLFDNEINMWGDVISSPSNLVFQEKIEHFIKKHDVIKNHMDF